MIIIVVRFAETGKDYKYLLVNPSNYKINLKVGLRCITGMSYDKPIYKFLWPVDTYKVETLPEVVTSQIVLLDENNNIDIQKIGSVSTIPVPITEKPEKIKSSITSMKAAAEAKKEVRKAERMAKITNDFSSAFKKAIRRY